MTTLSILKEARAKIASPQNWARFSRKTSLPDGGYAHCALGALDAAMGAIFFCERREPVRLLAAALTPEELAREPADTQGYFGPEGAVAKFNNASHHADVLGLFDRVIASLDTKKTDISIFTDMLKQPASVCSDG